MRKIASLVRSILDLLRGTVFFGLMITYSCRLKLNVTMTVLRCNHRANVLPLRVRYCSGGTACRPRYGALQARVLGQVSWLGSHDSATAVFGR